MPQTNEEKNLIKLQRLLSFMDDDALTNEKFAKYFLVVIDLIKKLQSSNQETLDKGLEILDNKVEEVVRRIKTGSANDIKAIKKEVLKEVMNECLGEVGDIRMELKEKLAKIKSGEDGKDADEKRVIEKATEKAIEAVKPLIPSATDIKNDIPVLGSQIRNALELLQGNEKLDMEAIKDLKETFEKLEKRLMEEVKKKVVITGSGGGASNGGRIVKSYDLSSQLNGVTTTFSLPTMWRVISVHLSSFPNILRQTTDYTWTPTSITFTSEVNPATSLSTGQSLVIVYAE